MGLEVVSGHLVLSFQQSAVSKEGSIKSASFAVGTPPVTTFQPKRLKRQKLNGHGSRID